MAGRYSVQGNVRFLSHQEAFRTIGRSLIRSGINLVYSQGYNPHLKMSLPLPKSVGLESADELFYAQIADEKLTEKEIYANITAQLPEGFTLFELAVHNGRKSFRPTEAEYFVKLDEQELNDVRPLINQINEIVRAGEKILTNRTVDGKGNVKIVDVSKFIKSFEETAGGIKAVCVITDDGTIRPDEILKLLGFKPSKLGTSTIRKKVNWQMY